MLLTKATRFDAEFQQQELVADIHKELQKKFLKINSKIYLNTALTKWVSYSEFSCYITSFCGSFVNTSLFQ